MNVATIKNVKLIKNKHDQIVDAAVRLIRDKGFDKTTLRDISAATRTSLGNLYAYIRSKDDILSLVHQRASELLSEKFAKVAVAGAPAEALGRLIEVEFDTKHTHQDLVMLMYRESHKLARQPLRGVLAAEERRQARFEQVIAGGVRAGVFRAVDPALLAHSIIAMIDGWVLRRWSVRKKASPEEMKRHVLDMVFSVLGVTPSGGEDAASRPGVGEGRTGT
jgi:AcrR family transcriptional regulator